MGSIHIAALVGFCFDLGTGGGSILWPRAVMVGPRPRVLLTPPLSVINVMNIIELNMLIIVLLRGGSANSMYV